eukprot:symbB.v1.2.032011.t1/scaffold3771.1/size50609/2
MARTKAMATAAAAGASSRSRGANAKKAMKSVKVKAKAKPFMKSMKVAVAPKSKAMTRKPRTKAPPKQRPAAAPAISEVKNGNSDSDSESDSDDSSSISTADEDGQSRPTSTCLDLNKDATPPPLPPLLSSNYGDEEETQSGLVGQCHPPQDILTGMSLQREEADQMKEDGAELLMHHIWLATTRKCEQMGISPLPEQPMPLLACDVDSDCQQVLLNHLYPPRYLVNNLLQFLKPSCVTTCKELCAKAAADREKLVAKIDAIKKKESKAKSKGKDKGTTEKQRKKKKQSAMKAKAKQDIHDLQQRIGQIGEELLLALVQEMSKKGNLKESVDAMNGKQAIGRVKLTYLVKMTQLASEKIILIAGSVCKDWSTMGKQNGFNGNFTMLCAVMLAICRRVRPIVFIHECTRLFPYHILEKALKGSTDHHLILDPPNHGAPVRRSRSYDAVIKPGWDIKLGRDHAMTDFARLLNKCSLDAGVWLQASQEEVDLYRYHLASVAMRGSKTDFRELLPPTARMNLQLAESWTWVQEQIQQNEMAMNLDQNPSFQAHIGIYMPCILASISHMWALKADRPFIPEDCNSNPKDSRHARLRLVGVVASHLGAAQMAGEFHAQIEARLNANERWAMHFEEIRTHQCLALEAGLIVGPRAPLSQAELAF